MATLSFEPPTFRGNRERCESESLKSLDSIKNWKLQSHLTYKQTIFLLTVLSLHKIDLSQLCSLLSFWLYTFVSKNMSLNVAATLILEIDM